MPTKWDYEERYRKFFIQATGIKEGPYPYQIRLATEEVFPELLDVPTGLGKTAAVVLAWLWRRKFDKRFTEQSPRRFVYCLPMRVLVEQTRDAIKKWIDNIVKTGLLDGKDAPNVHLLMGGEIDSAWDVYPERDAILIGTQDQLISRALNRGYAMSRYRWPVHFALLNNDCLWVMDEVQIFAAGLPTTTQMQAFRNSIGTFAPVQSVWMSATLHKDWLSSVDFKDVISRAAPFELDDTDRKSKGVLTRVSAEKLISKAKAMLSKDTAKQYSEQLAQEVLKAHQAGTLTLVVINRVDRAKDVFKQLHKLTVKSADPPELLLLHSRFRPFERKQKMDTLFSPLPASGRIVVATQVVEAGVDISAKVLFTELAPWASLVQRFGRCNRKGEYLDGEARIYWIDIDRSAKETDFRPYEIEELELARKKHTKSLKNAAPQLLPKVEPAHKINHVLRRRDLLDLFDTTADLAGNDIDVSRYIRDSENIDVHVFWRSWEGDSTPPEMNAPARAEFCAVPVYAFKEFLKIKDKEAWRWNGLYGEWERITSEAIYPGQQYLLHTEMGGYNVDTGWDKDAKTDVTPLAEIGQAELDKNDADYGSVKNWQTLTAHTNMVRSEILSILEALANPALPKLEMEKAAVWHDAGKAHEVAQDAFCKGNEDKRTAALWAKSLVGKLVYARRHFRHELASGLAALQNGQSDLVAYLAAAHHGKVRLSIRSLPGEDVPDNPEIRFARGVRDGDELPEIELSEAETMKKTVLDLEPMEMGEGKNGLSWLARALKLRDDYGLFRLAYLEALIKAADERASGKQEVGHE